MKTLTSEESLNSNFNKLNPQDCPFCGKTCKNSNSYKQHICRCRNNPNRIESAKRDFKAQYANLSQESKDKMAWNRGLTADESSSIRQQVANRPKEHSFEDIYCEHNKQEIDKWFLYIEHKLIPAITNYRDIANYLLEGNLQNTNYVHHIDLNHSNNDKNNLLIFVDGDNHKRYHNSKYAKLVYDQETHLFSCYIDKSCI